MINGINITKIGGLEIPYILKKCPKECENIRRALRVYSIDSFRLLPNEGICTFMGHATPFVNDCRTDRFMQRCQAHARLLSWRLASMSITPTVSVFWIRYETMLDYESLLFHYKLVSTNHRRCKHSARSPFLRQQPPPRRIFMVNIKLGDIAYCRCLW